MKRTLSPAEKIAKLEADAVTAYDDGYARGLSAGMTTMIEAVEDDMRYIRYADANNHGGLGVSGWDRQQIAQYLKAVHDGA